MARDSQTLKGVLVAGTNKLKTEVEEHNSIREKEVNLSSAEILKKEVRKAQSRPTMEDTHVRSTFLFRRDLQERLDRIAETQPRGFKTKFLNIAIESLLDQIEERNKG